jgi:hypothetical protein
MDGEKSLGDRAMDAAARLAWGHDGKQWSDEDVHEAGCLLVELRDALDAAEREPTEIAAAQTWQDSRGRWWSPGVFKPHADRDAAAAHELGRLRELVVNKRRAAALAAKEADRE